MAIASRYLQGVQALAPIPERRRRETGGDGSTSDHIGALQGLGYTEREARFLEFAALHSGYFVRRQFNAFIGHTRGGIAAAFIKKLSDHKLMTRDIFLRHAHVYHLSAKPLYIALGQRDNRHRRRRSPFGIKTKLMALDFVLAHGHDRFLATEQERIAYFDRLDVDRLRLPSLSFRAHTAGPATTRYFVEKFPLSVDESLTPPRVSLAYIDIGAWSVEGFETFLQRYTPLIHALPYVRLVYIADTCRNFDAAHARFDRWRRSSSDPLGVPRDAAGVARMLAWFELEQWVETDQVGKIPITRFPEYREGRDRFRTAEGQRLYALWKDGGDAAVHQELARATGAGSPHVFDFTTHQLPHDYSFLGTVGYGY